MKNLWILTASIIVGTEVMCLSAGDVFMSISRKAIMNQPPGSIGASRIVIDRNDLEVQRPNTINDAIANVPGVFGTRRASLGFGIGPASVGGVSIRGSSTGQRVLVAIDGRPDMMGIFGHPLNDSYTAETAERIEVIRGPDSVRFGSGALGGSVNHVSKRRHEEGMETGLELSGGSYGTRTGIIRHGAKLGRFDYYLVGSNRHSDGFRDNSSVEAGQIYSHLGYEWTPSYGMDLNIRHNDTTAEDPGTLSEVAVIKVRNAGFNKWARAMRSGFDLTLNEAIGPTQGSVKAYVNYGNNIIRHNAVSRYLWNSIDRTYGAIVSQRAKPAESTDVELGYDVKKSGGEGHELSTRTDYPERSIVEQGVFTYVKQVAFEKLTGSIGARAHRHEGYGWEFIPGAGLEYSPLPSTVLKGSVRKGFRSPTITELFNAVPQANAGLASERAWNYEVGVSQQFGERASAAISVYHLEGDNLIRAEGLAPALKFRNSGKFVHRGLEGNVQMRVLPFLDLAGGWTLSDPGNETRANPEQRYTLSAQCRVQKFYGEISAEKVEKLYGDDFKLSLLRNYAIVGVRANFKVSSNLKVFAQADNLFNEYYEIVAGYPMPGINGMGGVEIAF